MSAHLQLLRHVLVSIQHFIRQGEGQSEIDAANQTQQTIHVTNQESHAVVVTRWKHTHTHTSDVYSNTCTHPTGSTTSHCTHPPDATLQGHTKPPQISMLYVQVYYVQIRSVN